MPILEQREKKRVSRLANLELMEKESIQSFLQSFSAFFMISSIPDIFYYIVIPDIGNRESIFRIFKVISLRFHQ